MTSEVVLQFSGEIGVYKLYDQSVQLRTDQVEWMRKMGHKVDDVSEDQVPELMKQIELRNIERAGERLRRY